jgi:hypothetical protein
MIILKKRIHFKLRKFWFLGNSAQQLSSDFSEGLPAQLRKIFSQLSSLSSAKNYPQLSSAQLFFSKFATLDESVDAKGESDQQRNLSHVFMSEQVENRVLFSFFIFIALFQNIRLDFLQQRVINFGICFRSNIFQYLPRFFFPTARI